jgi:hypothetical protein
LTVEYYVCILSFVDKDLLEPGCSILIHHKNMAVVGVLADDADPMVSVMKVEKAPTESYADVGGLDQQVQEIKVWYIFLIATGSCRVAIDSSRAVRGNGNQASKGCYSLRSGMSFS